MAVPITSIEKIVLTPEEIKQNKLEKLQSLIVEQDQAINKIVEITGELDGAGVLDALRAMVMAKDDIAKIAVDQASRDPVTNIINHVLNATSVISSIDPDVTAKLAASVKTGLHEAELYSGNGQKVSIFQLMTALNDPDTNRAVKFGLDFLKGMGKGLELDGK